MILFRPSAAGKKMLLKPHLQIGHLVNSIFATTNIIGPKMGFMFKLIKYTRAVIKNLPVAILIA